VAAVGRRAPRCSSLFQRTLLYTYPLHTKIEVTGSGNAIVWVDRGIGDLWVFNLGFALSKDLNKWAVRPEAGYLIDPGDDRHAWHLSLGFTDYAGKGR
jgi:hypothetical protein